MIIDNMYDIGDIVYLKTDTEQKKRFVTAIQVSLGNVILYRLTCEITESYHYGMECNSEKDYLVDADIEISKEK